MPQLADRAPEGGATRVRADLVAGLTTAAVVIPKAMAYATVAGLPVEVGLYTAFVPMVVYALLGTSRPLSVSTTTTLAILTGANLALAVPDGNPAALLAAAATLSILVGAILVLASLLRLGFVASFISEPVLIGFKAGIGVVIVVDQLPKLLGIHLPSGPFLQKLLALVAHLPETSPPTLALGVAMIAILAALERWLPRLPAPLVAVAAGIAVSALFAQRLGIDTVGRHPAGTAGAHAAAARSRRRAVAGRARHRLDELHRNHRRRPRLRRPLRATAGRQPGVAGDRRRQRRRRPLRRHAGGRRHLADGGEPTRRRPDATGGAGHRRDHGRHAAAAGAADRPDAAGDAGGRRHRLLARPHPCWRTSAPS